MTDELIAKAQAALREDLSPAAKAALRELANSGPGIPGPHETDELVAAGLAVRVVQLTSIGMDVAKAQSE